VVVDGFDVVEIVVSILWRRGFVYHGVDLDG
jgi:hypothetical protein